MNAAKSKAGIYNIPSGIPFARSIAAQLISETDGNKSALASYRVILPTRRAARILQQAFLEETRGEPLLLPRLQILGDIDEEELSLSMAGTGFSENILHIPPALPTLKRQVLLARTIMAIRGYAHNFEQAMLLARALAQLMDKIYTENLGLENLAGLVPEDFADHWQITLKFMTILSERWPQVLEENGAIDAADRRNRLLQALTGFWRESPPETPVIAAGTTGSIPATAELLRTIAALPQGRVVLPGLDTDMDPESWKALDETHPQYGLRHLLEVLGIDRASVSVWSQEQNHPLAGARRRLASEIMRPPETAGFWAEKLPLDTALQQTLKKATENLELLTCANEREEAAAIAVLLRQSLETPGRTAALITPRRDLARRVAVACRRWGIMIDDSAGQPLGQTLAGSFLLLCVEAAARTLSPASLLALLKHPLSKAQNVQGLDYALRGPRPAPGLEGLHDRDKGGVTRFIEPLLMRFMNGSNPEKPMKMAKIVEAHLALAETLAGGAEALWQKDDGEAAARFFDSLTEQADLFPDLDLSTYHDVLAGLFKTVPVRPSYGAHPRLRILGQLEARMTDADLIIMGGLNEKTWPPDPGHDPWMSRPMMKEFGLPGPERQIGLAAHDFVQGFCAPKVVMTRSLRQDGAPAVPARWLQRLTAVIEAAGLAPDVLATSKAIQWVHKLDESPVYVPLRRPEPRPPVPARPRRISVTQVEKWQRDPYSIYAKYILGLEPLDPLEKPVDAAEKGTILHETMKIFVQQNPAAIPVNAEKELIKIAAREIAARHDDPAAWSFWLQRFERAAHWIAQHEREWRLAARSGAVEVKGEIKIAANGGEFVLHGRADRIDIVPLGAAIIDYKSGGNYPSSQIVSGKLPQLPLEGLILVRNGFEHPDLKNPVSLQYWKLGGGKDPGEVQGIESGVEGIIERAGAGLRDLVNAFDDENTPYYSIPRPENAPRFNDYKHLARINEWAALGDDDSSEAA